MDSEMVGQEVIGIEITRMNAWLDDAIHDAQRSFEALREIRAGTDSLIDQTMTNDEYAQLRQVADNIQSACVSMSRTRALIDGLST